VFASFGLTGVLRQYALSRKLIDTPNERSSHKVPTPRGGGLAIVITYLAALLWLELGIELHMEVWTIVLAGGWIALVGWLDDHNDVSPKWRLLAHFIAASSALVSFGGLPPLPVFGFMLDFGWLGHVLASVYLVWLLNLYNFMDGIDGIAGIEAVTVCLGGILLYLLTGGDELAWELPLLLTCAVLGFFFWNFPKAKIFMGDVGSSFLGFVIGILSIQAAWIEPELFWGWIILLGAFVVDATVTLFRRVLRGEQFYKAHRSHAYQRASQKIGAHAPVSLLFGAVNLFWLLPVASLVVIGGIDGLMGVIVAYLPLVWLALRYGAGED
jgi:Fuc2NAc and GlcNAc transferase